MIIRNGERPRYSQEKMRGGEGIIEHIDLLPAELRPKCSRFFSVLTLNKGCEIGLHNHVGESETYVVLSGEGVTFSDGKEEIIYPGDVSFTGFGDEHYTKNVKDDPLVVLAIVMND